MSVTHLMACLGTTHKYPWLKTRHSSTFERIGTIHFLWEAVSPYENQTTDEHFGITKCFNPVGSVTKTIINGPNYIGTNIREKIALGLLDILKVLAKGDPDTTINLIGHSRGSIEIILIVNYLQLVKTALERYYGVFLLEILTGSSKLLLQELELTRALYTVAGLTDVKFEKAKTYLEIFLTELNDKFKKPIITLSCHTLNIRRAIQKCKINIATNEPVPGGIRFTTWCSPLVYYIPPLVRSFIAIIAADERTSAFHGVVPRILDPKTFLEIEILPGHHGTAAGRLSYQKTKDGPVLDEYGVPVNTAVVQELVICKFILFLCNNGCNVTVDGIAKIKENIDSGYFKKIYTDLYPKSSAHVISIPSIPILQSIKYIVSQFISLMVNPIWYSHFLLCLYDEISRNLPAFRTMRKHHYSVLKVEQKTAARHVHFGYAPTTALITSLPNYGEEYDHSVAGGIINVQHRLLREYYGGIYGVFDSRRKITMAP